MVKETDRPVGFLKEKHRNYLRGDSDIEPKTQGERDVRRYIREHLRNAILDFSDVYGDDGHRIEARDRWDAFGGRRPAEGGGAFGSNFVRMVDDSDELVKKPDEKIKQGFIDAVAFIYSAAEDAGIGGNHVVKRGIQRYAQAESADWVKPRVRLEFDTRESRAYRAEQKIKNGKPPEELTDEEIRALLFYAGGPLTPERIYKYLHGEWSWPPEEMEDTEERGTQSLSTLSDEYVGDLNEINDPVGWLDDTDDE